MTKVIIDVFYAFFAFEVQFIVNPLLTSFDRIFDLIPGYDSLVNIMWSTFNQYIFPFTYWFASIIPPRSLEVIILELTLYIFFINLSIPMWIVSKVFSIIKKLPLA